MRRACSALLVMAVAASCGGSGGGGAGSPAASPTTSSRSMRPVTLEVTGRKALTAIAYGVGTGATIELTTTLPWRIETRVAGGETARVTAHIQGSGNARIVCSITAGDPAAGQTDGTTDSSHIVATDDRGRPVYDGQCDARFELVP